MKRENLESLIFRRPVAEDAPQVLELLIRCEERGPTLAREQGSCGEQVARAYVAHVNQRDRAVVEQASFQPGQYYFQMRIDLSSASPEPNWPEGATVRPFVVG